MGYTTLSIRKNNTVKKYILFYADYLNEAWLSEVLENDTTRIIKQFKCKSLADLNDLADYISRSGEIINLTSNETAEVRLKILERQLKRKQIPLQFPKLDLFLASFRMFFRNSFSEISFPN